jgi:hypothetical protein
MYELTKELVFKAYDANIVVYDCDSLGKMTFRLIALIKTVMRNNYGKVTDIYMSEVAKADLVDALTNTKLDATIVNDFAKMLLENVDVHDGLGERAKFQTYFVDELGATLPNHSKEIIIALCKNEKGIQALAGSF